VKYPLGLAKFNKIVALGAGAIILCIGGLSVFESISRTFFNSPTVWTNDFSLYIFIWAIFMGSAYAYQENGHVAVDLLRDIVQKAGGKLPRLVMAIIGYVLSATTIIVLLYAATRMALRAISVNQLTVALIQIPVIYLDLAMVLGSLHMIITLVFIILDLLSGGEKYL
jgi:TRAP-type C4-dicarboxylate transport system permease small subunit